MATNGGDGGASGSGGAGGSGDGARGVLGRSAGRAARLPSYRPPRDLTLGASSRRTFVPNIPARPRGGDKAKEEESHEGRSHSRDRHSKRGDRGGRGRGGERGRGRGRGRGAGPELLQTQSIFEQGAAERSKPKTSYEPMERGGGGGGGSGGKATGSKALKRERDDEETKEIIDALLRDDFIENEGLTSSNPSMDPIQLPLYSLKLDAKSEPAVKEEEEGGTEGGESERPPLTPAFGAQRKEPITVAEVLNMPVKSEHGEFIMMQLPDTLPGEPPEPPQPPRPSRDAPSTSTTPAPPTKEPNRPCTLRDLPEGKIGKLQVRKSGKVQLVIGNIALDVNMGTPTGYLQEVVNCQIGEPKEGPEGNMEITGDMTVVGNVNHKFVCIPDFEAMLDAEERRSKR